MINSSPGRYPGGCSMICDSSRTPIRTPAANWCRNWGLAGCSPSHTKSSPFLQYLYRCTIPLAFVSPVVLYLYVEVERHLCGVVFVAVGVGAGEVFVHLEGRPPAPLQPLSSSILIVFLKQTLNTKSPTSTSVIFYSSPLSSSLAACNLAKHSSLRRKSFQYF